MYAYTKDSLVLRDYQTRALEAVLADLPHHQSLGLIAPTGAGKTILMQAIAEAVLDHHTHKSNAIIVSHLSVLQAQTLRGFEERCKYMTGMMQGQKMPSYLSKVIITTMQTLRNEKVRQKMRARLLSNETQLIMVDEAQMYGASSYEIIRDSYPDAKIIGFSASPYRNGMYSFNQFEKVSYAISLQELIDDGWLCEPRLHQIDLAGMDIEERMAHVAGIYLKCEHPKGSLVYWRNKADARAATVCFIDAGIPACTITDDTPPVKKQTLLKQFEEGTIKVINNVNVLSAGYDSTKVYSIFMPMGTSSPVNYIQRVGRGLRRERGKDYCNVYIYGDAPSIKRGLYQKIQRVALKAKDDPEYGKKNDIYEQADWLEAQESVNDERLKWTRQAIDACQKFKALNMNGLAHLIRFQKFPKRYLNTIVKLAPRDNTEEGTISPSQLKFLEDKGFTKSEVEGLAARESVALISMIQSRLNQEWIVNYGLHANKHISEVPMAYIGALAKKKQWKHQVFKLYQKWKAEGKPMEEES